MKTKYKQVDAESFENQLGTRALDKKVVTFVIADAQIQKSMKLPFPFIGEITRIDILIGTESSAGTTKLNVIKVSNDIETIVNNTLIEIPPSTKLIQNIALNIENVNLNAYDVLYINITEEATIRPGNITISIEIEI